MSNDTNEDFDEDYEEDEDKTPAWYRKDMKRQANVAATAKAEATAAKRELAFLRAGVDTTSPVGALFIKAYEGGLEPEAVKSEWEKIVMPTPTPTPPANTEDVNAQRSAALLRDGETQSPLLRTGTVRSAIELAQDMKSRTGSVDDAAAEYLRARRQEMIDAQQV